MKSSWKGQLNYATFRNVCWNYDYYEVLEPMEDEQFVSEINGEI